MNARILLFVVLANSILANSQTILIRTNVEIAGFSCEKDTTSRVISFEKLEENQFRKVNTFTSNKCNDEFILPNVLGQYKIVVKSLNCDEKAVEFRITAGKKEINVEKIILFKQKDVSLGEVTIVGNKKEFIKIDADKTTYLVKGNSALTSGSISDAIRKLPGVLLSPTGNINLNGKDVAVYIDGVPANLSGQDLKNYIQSLPANTIEKIELIENPGASFEANANGAVINIITRANSFKSFSGVLNLHYGTSKNNKYSPSVMLNGRKKTINWQLQTGYNSHEFNDFTTVNRTFTSFTPNVLFYQDADGKDLNNNFYFRPMVNFRINENTNFILNYNLNTAENGTKTTSLVHTLNWSPDFNYANSYNNQNNNTNHEVVGKFKTKLDTLGKTLQITAYYSMFDKSALAKSSLEQNNSYLYSINDIRLNLNNFYVKYDFELPFKTFQINTGGKYNLSNAGNVGKYNLNNPVSTIFDNPTYPNQLDFKYNESNIAMYAEFKKSFGKLRTTVGIRFEDLKYNSNVLAKDTTIINLFPTFNLLYQFTSNLNMTGRYSRKIAMPPYSQLDPNSSGYFDRYTSTVGNPYLKPNFYDNYSLTLSAFNYVNLGANYSYTKNISLLTLNTQPNSLVSDQTFSNYGNIQNYNIYTAFPVPFGLITKGKAFFNEPMDMDKMSYLYFYIAYNRQIIKDYPYADGSAHPFWVFSVNSQIVLPYKLKLNIEYFYLSKGNFQIYQVENPMQYWLVDLTRKFLKDNLELTVEAMKDVKQEISFNTPHLKTNFSNQTDGLTFWFKLTYRFGEFKSKEETQIDIEKKQVESGGLNIK